MNSNDVMSAQVSRCVHRWGAQKREPQCLHGRGQGRSPKSADVGNSEWVGNSGWKARGTQCAKAWNIRELARVWGN